MKSLFLSICKESREQPKVVNASRPQRPLPAAVKFNLVYPLWFFIGIMVLACTLVSGYGYENDVDLNERSFRFGFSRKMFAGVNENDAVAAIRIWAKSLSDDFGIPVDPKPLLFLNAQEAKSVVQRKEVEMVCLLTEEFAQIKSLFKNDQTLCGVRADSSLELYCLLTNKKDNYSDIKALENKTFGIVKQGEYLGCIWIDSCLLELGLPVSDKFFGSTLNAKRVDNLIYQLFFQQIDACVVPQNVFELLTQLNPQIGQTLNIMASSPPVIPVVFAFRAKSDHPLVKLTIDALSHLHESPAGAQLMTLFRLERLKIEPTSLLDSTFNMIETYNRLSGKSRPRP